MNKREFSRRTGYFWEVAHENHKKNSSQGLQEYKSWMNFINLSYSYRHCVHDKLFGGGGECEGVVHDGEKLCRGDDNICSGLLAIS